MLKNIKIILPSGETGFDERFLKFIGSFGQAKNGSVDFSRSHKDFYPKISLNFAYCAVPYVEFIGEGNIRVEIKNSTGEERRSPHQYSLITLKQFEERASRVKVNYLDHVGFDLPWFDGIHPEIKELRDSLAKESLYFRYPTGEDWDFIVPGTEKDILSREIDYKIIRRPKFEIVSIDKVSKPIIQFDFSVFKKYEEIKKLFPEGIADDCLKNIWVYIQNPYDVDICFVVGQSKNTDWYRFLKKGLIK